MKIGIVVDGVAEYKSMGLVLGEIARASGHAYIGPVKADIQPTAPFPRIGRSCQAAIRQLAGRGAQRVLVLIDRETRRECPGLIATEVARAASRGIDCEVIVVVKDVMYENWLVADLDALAAQTGRFDVKPAHRRKVEPGRADTCEAKALLGRMLRGDSYSKVDDSRIIMARVDPLKAGKHSRSFRKLLQGLGHPTYRTQTKRSG